MFYFPSQLIILIYFTSCTVHQSIHIDNISTLNSWRAPQKDNNIDMHMDMDQDVIVVSDVDVEVDMEYYMDIDIDVDMYIVTDLDRCAF